MTRSLLEIRRRIGLANRRAYDRAWLTLQQRVDASGAHAWRFRKLDDPDAFVEFLEYKADRDPRENLDIREQLQELDAISPGTVEELADAPTAPSEGIP